MVWVPSGVGDGPYSLGWQYLSVAELDHLNRGQKKDHSLSGHFNIWLRKPDLNRRPSGYEPDELPDCSIPRRLFYTDIACCQQKMCF